MSRPRAALAEQLAVALGAGLSLAAAAESIRPRSAEQDAAITALSAAVDAGPDALDADALRRHLGPSAPALIRAGLRSGRLDRALSLLAAHLAAAPPRRRLAGPALLLLAPVALYWAPPPLSAVGQALGVLWLALGIGASGALIARGGGGASRATWSASLLRPWLRDPARARFLGVLALTLEAGLDLRGALETARAAVGHPTGEAEARRVDRSLRDGESLAAALGATSLLDPAEVHMLTAAETSGRLPEVLQRLVEEIHTRARERRERGLRMLAAAPLLLWTGLGLLMLVMLAN